MPKKFGVVIGEKAKSDVGAIHQLIARDKKTAAKKWLRDFHVHVRSLRLFPERYETVPEAPDLPEQLRHLRHIVFGNYRIIYEIGQKEVTIVRVIHAARMLQRALTEFPPPASG